MNNIAIGKTYSNVLLFVVAAILFGCDAKIQEEISLPIQQERIRITNDPWLKRDIAWSLDGAHIAFATARERTELSKFSIIENRETGKLGDIFDQIDGKAALSADGKKLAYSSVNRSRQIWLFNFEDGTEKSLPIGYQFVADPAWSHDGEWLAYTAWDSVYRIWSIWIIQSNGVNSRRITLPAEMSARTPTWSPDGTQLAFQALKLNTGTNTEAIWIASVAGGNIHKLTSNSSNEYYPAWSPDGSKIAFVSRRHDTSGVWIMPVQGGPERKLIDFADAPSWSPDGSKLAVRISSGVGIYSFVDGTLTRLSTPSIYYPLWLDSNTIVSTEVFNFSQLTVVELQNSQIKFPIAALGSPGDREPAWFPDNNTIAFTKAELGKQEIWTVSLVTGESRLLLANIPGENFFYNLQNPAISPNGMRLACDNGRDIFIISPSGGGLRKLAADLNEPLTQPAWSPDGKQLACRTAYGLRIFRVQENRIEPQAYFPGDFLNASWSAVHPSFGSHIAFERDGSIYILSLTDQKPELVISGGRYPSWSPDGTKIAYVFGNDIYVSTVLVPFSD